MDNSTPIIFTLSKEDRVPFKAPNNNITSYSLKGTIDGKYLRNEKPQVTIKYSEISNFLSKALSI